MTEHTAEDFAHARVAIQGDRESARRTYPSDDMPWLSRNGGRWSDHALAERGWVPVQESQPLTADDITDEMVERGAQQYVEEGYVSWRRTPGTVKNNARESVRGILRAALTEPTRPEGAEEIEADIRELVASHPEDHYGELADHLAAMGYRKDKQ